MQIIGHQLKVAMQHIYSSLLWRTSEWNEVSKNKKCRVGTWLDDSRSAKSELEDTVFSRGELHSQFKKKVKN